MPSQPTPLPARTLSAGQHAVLICLVVALAAWLGIHTRALFDLATIWPANAVLMALLVRRSVDHRVGAGDWVAATIGYLIPDLITTNQMSVDYKLALTAANLAGVYISYRCFLGLSRRDRMLQRSMSMLWLLLAVAAGSLASAAVGTVASAWWMTLEAPQTFYLNWFLNSLGDGLLFSAPILAMPHGRSRPLLLQPQTPRQRQRNGISPKLGLLLPLATLVALAAVGRQLGDFSGTAFFIVPGLIWCALCYSLFVTSLISLAVTLQQLEYATSVLTRTLDHDIGPYELGILRLGLALLAFGPLTAAAVSTQYREMLGRLEAAVTTDALTGALSRATFMQRASECLEARLVAAVAMIDLDHFKSINDNHGHAVGDAVLRHFADCVRLLLPPDALFGRTGGEEFALVFPGHDAHQANELLHSIRATLAAMPCELTDRASGRPLALVIRMSAGIHEVRQGKEDIDTALHWADEALYQAKREGRDRIHLSTAATGNPPPDADQSAIGLPETRG